MSASSTSAMTVSEVFNEAAGDFALMSSDGVIFYVSTNLLQLNSKLFATTLEVGTSEDKTPISMQADAKSLETILKLAHPSYDAPYICDVSTLADLLRITKQYEMYSVTHQLRASFTSIRVKNGVLYDPITTQEPLAAFVVAIAFDFLDEARLALRAVIDCDLNQELGKTRKYEIPLHFMQRILDLRSQRAGWLLGKLSILSRLVVDFCQGVITTSDNASIREDASERMAQCLRWELRASQALYVQPTFTTLKHLVCDKDSGAITCGIFRGIDVGVVWQLIASWEAKVTADSNRLPELEDPVEPRE